MSSFLHQSNELLRLSIVKCLCSLTVLVDLAFDVIENHLGDVFQRQFLIPWSLLVALLLL
jgi:hypothetical protein